MKKIKFLILKREINLNSLKILINQFLIWIINWFTASASSSSRFFWFISLFLLRWLVVVLFRFHLELLFFFFSVNLSPFEFLGRCEFNEGQLSKRFNFFNSLERVLEHCHHFRGLFWIFYHTVFKLSWFYYWMFFCIFNDPTNYFAKSHSLLHRIPFRLNLLDHSIDFNEHLCNCLHLWNSDYHFFIYEFARPKVQLQSRNRYFFIGHRFSNLLSSSKKAPPMTGRLPRTKCLEN